MFQSTKCSDSLLAISACLGPPIVECNWVLCTSFGYKTRLVDGSRVQHFQGFCSPMLGYLCMLTSACLLNKVYVGQVGICLGLTEAVINLLLCYMDSRELRNCVLRILWWIVSACSSPWRYGCILPRKQTTEPSTATGPLGMSGIRSYQSDQSPFGDVCQICCTTSLGGMKSSNQLLAFMAIAGGSENNPPGWPWDIQLDQPLFFDAWEMCYKSLPREATNRCNWLSSWEAMTGRIVEPANVCPCDVLCNS